MKKIRVTVPYFIKQSLTEDLEHFKISLSKLGNNLFAYYSNRDTEKINLKSLDNEIIQFNLNRVNEDMYFKVLQEHNVETEAEYIRNILFSYLNNPRYKREEIIFTEIFNNIRKAIKQKKKINIKYNDEIRTVNSYFIKEADRENSSYLFCYCETNNDYRNYRITNIKNIAISKLDLQTFDEDYIKQVAKNFDPFNSYGKKVEVILTEKGKSLLDKIIDNRPKLLEIKNNTYIFQCTNKLAKVYFPQFLSEAKIISPIELREWFENKFKSACLIYEG